MRHGTHDTDRFTVSLGLTAVSRLWLTVAQTTRMTVLCRAGALLGADGAVRFRWLRPRTRGEETCPDPAGPGPRVTAADRGRNLRTPSAGAGGAPGRPGPAGGRRIAP